MESILLQILRIGPEDAAGSDAGDLALAPDSAVQMNISGCAQVELLSKTFNSVPTLSHLKLSDLRSLVLHSRLYEARAGNGQSSTLKTFTIENVSYFDGGLLLRIMSMSLSLS